MYSDILLTVDYDRTLTGPDSTIPQANLEAIEYFIAHGGTFTVNTGRSVPMSRCYLDKVPTNANSEGAFNTKRLLYVPV